jgi:hypothetical protein
VRLLKYSFDGIFYKGYSLKEKWAVEYTDEFGLWWYGLVEEEQVSIAASVQLLEEKN